LSIRGGYVKITLELIRGFGLIMSFKTALFLRDPMKFSLLLRSIFAAFLLMAATVNAQADNHVDPENTLYLDIEFGRVVIELYPRVAPRHVKRVKELVRDKFYDGLKFHRVIEGFMAQTGDPLGNGRGGSGKKIRAEFSNIPHDRGTVSMARASSPNSADSQFFIVLQDSAHLNGKYTVFGKVVSGMKYVDQIRKGLGRGGMVRDPDIILSLRVAADVK
jgi:cyclophilin family peptidyl-prolyl cis-trans isomerase